MRRFDSMQPASASDKLYIVYKEGEETSSQPLSSADAVETYNRLKNDGYKVQLFHLTPSSINWSITIHSNKPR